MKILMKMKWFIATMEMYTIHTAYIVLFVIAFLIIIGISNAFIYFHWFLKKSNTNITNINHYTETIIY